MDQNTFDLNNQTYANNNNILLGIINEFQQIINSSREDLTIKRISDIIIKMNFFYNENKKYYESIMNQFANLENELNQLKQNFKINDINNQKELELKNGRYVGQVVNGLREGKGIYYVYNGDRYEGEWKNDKREGKGIEYFNNGDRYEGDWKDDKKQGKGIYYYLNGDRSMGNYSKNSQIGKHVMLTKYGDVLWKEY